jgi:hypothetical protein
VEVEEMKREGAEFRIAQDIGRVGLWFKLFEVGSITEPPGNICNKQDAKYTNE